MKKPTAPASAYNTKPSTDCRRERTEDQLGPSRLLPEPRGGDFHHTNLQGNEDGAGTDGKGEHGDHHTHHQVGVQDLTLQSQETQPDCLLRGSHAPQPQTGQSSIPGTLIIPIPHHRLAHLLWQRVWGLCPGSL